MNLEPCLFPAPVAAEVALQVYLLGSVDFEVALNLQRQLVYQLSGERSSACLILCEHAPLITVGREGSRSHILCEPEELKARRWSIRWVNRGGGCWLHLPGQLAIYPVLPLDRLGLSLRAYLDRLHEVLTATLADFAVGGEARHGKSGVWVGSRPIAAVGVAVRDWVAYFGAALNVNPDLQPYRRVRLGHWAEDPMTSLARERRGCLAPALVRQRLLEHFSARFQFSRTSVFFDHPSLRRKARADAIPASS